MKNIYSILAVLVFVLSGCEGEEITNVGSIDCGDTSIDVLSIKNPKRLGYAQSWGFAVKAHGKRLKIVDHWHPGFLPPSFTRTIVGKGKTLEPDHPSFPYGKALHFFLGAFEEKSAGEIEKCLAKNDGQLRALLLKTYQLEKYPRKDFENERFVYWRGTQDDLKIKFAVGKGVYITPLMTGSVYYFHNDKSMRVGDLVYDKTGKLSGVHITLEPRGDIVPSNTDATKYVFEGKTLMEYFGIPLVPEPPSEF